MEQTLRKENVLSAVLTVLAEADSPNKKELHAHMASRYTIGHEELLELLDWATFSLKVAGLVERNLSATSITPQGKTFMEKHPEGILPKHLKEIPEFNAYFMKL